MKNFLILLMLSVFPVFAVSAKPVASMELAYALVNPDFESEFEGLDNESSVSLLFDVSSEKKLGASLRYTHGDFKTGGPKLGLATISGWVELSLYKQWAINNRFSVQPSLNYHRISIDEPAGVDNQQGLGYGVKGLFDVLPKLRLAVDISYVDTDDLNDWQLTAETLVPLTNQLGWTVRLRDYDESDFTIYETGLKWKF